jgi:transposase InsO family protein
MSISPIDDSFAAKVGSAQAEVTPIETARITALMDAARGERSSLQVVTEAQHPELARLLNIQAQQGFVPTSEYKAASEALGIGTRQLQRKLKSLRGGEAAAIGRRPFELTHHHKQVIFACCGNVALAYRELLDAGEDLPGEDTFWRAWSRLPVPVQKYARKGGQGMSEYFLYPPYEAPERNAVWQADHFELPIEVIADGCTTTTVKPWLTLFEDDKTRKVMSWAITATPGRHPDADVVCATLVAGIETRIEHGEEVGGVPGFVRWDNAQEFNAGVVQQMGLRVGFEIDTVPPYSGHMKGKVERLGKTVQDQFCPLQPGYTHGPKTYTGKDLQRSVPKLTAAQLRGRLDIWFAEYDTRHRRRQASDGTSHRPTQAKGGQEEGRLLQGRLLHVPGAPRHRGPHSGSSLPDRAHA